MVQGRFQRQQRLTRPAEFKRVFDRPCKVGGRHALVLARANDLSQARLGLAIPKRHIRTAVQRNRIKRLARESFRAHAGQLSGVDCVVLARSGLDRLSNADMWRLFDRLWRDVSQRCRPSSCS